MKKFFSGVLCFLIIFGLTGCKTVVSTTPERAKLTKVTVSEPTRGILWGPVHLAKELGFFKEEGLEVDIVTVEGDARIAPVLSGDAQFGLFGPEIILSLNEKGQDLKLIITTTKKYPYTFFVRPEYVGRSLKGTTVSGADSGSSPRQFVRSALRELGLNPDSDASFVTLGGAGIIAAFKNKDISATYATPEFRELLLNEGGVILTDMYDPATHKKILGSETYEMYITFARADYIKENPEIVQKYVNAVYKGIRWINCHTVEEITAAIRPSFINNENLEIMVREIKNNDIYSLTGDFTSSGFAAINKVALEAGLIDNYLTREKVIDDSFLKKAQKNIQ